MIYSKDLAGPCAKVVKDSSEQILHIASIDTVATKWLPEATVMFQNMFPDVHIDMITGDPFEINDWIKDGTADIGLTEKAWASDDYTFIELFRDPCICPSATVLRSGSLYSV